MKRTKTQREAQSKIMKAVWKKRRSERKIPPMLQLADALLAMSNAAQKLGYAEMSFGKDTITFSR